MNDTRTEQQKEMGQLLAEIDKRSYGAYDTGSVEKITLDGSNKVQFPGFAYTFEALGERILVSVDIPLTGYECKVCKGKKQIEIKDGRGSRFETCVECNGNGGLIIIPKSSKNLPTTGVVVSMGEIAKERASFKIGDRILFSPHTGTMIPTKAGLMFKYMDWYAATVRIEGAEELSAFDFILNTDE